MILVTILLSFILVGNSFSIHRVFYIMGTYAVIELPEEKEVYRAYRTLKEIEILLSDYLDGSDISRINRMAGTRQVEVSDITIEAIRKAIEVSEITGGVFDVTVGSLTINHNRLGKITQERAMELVDYRKVLLSGNRIFLKEKGMALDLGGIGKGFALDVVRRKIGTRWGFVSVGGDMVFWGRERVIGIRDPESGGGRAILYLSGGKDLCISTSGNYHRKHITKRDPDLLQVTVIHPKCYLADSLATALFSMTLKERRHTVRKVRGIAVVEVYRDRSIWMTPSVFKYFSLVHFPDKGKEEDDETVSQ